MDRIFFFLLPSFVGAVFAFMAFRGWKTGKMHGRGATVIRSESPRIFRATLVVTLVGAIGFFAVGFAFLVGLIPFGPKP